MILIHFPLKLDILRKVKENYWSTLTHHVDFEYEGNNLSVKYKFYKTWKHF